MNNDVDHYIVENIESQYAERFFAGFLEVSKNSKILLFLWKINKCILDLYKRLQNTQKKKHI